MPFFILILLFLVSALPVGAQTSAASFEEWQKISGNARDLSINADGQSYVIGVDGTPWRWDRQEARWRRMSGNFLRISAAEGNRPWAVASDGTVFRYNGLWWEDKEQNVMDVSSDTNNNVYILQTNGSLKKWYPLRSEWHDVPQPTTFIAQERFRSLTMGPDETLWAVTYQNRIFSFRDDEWQLHSGLARALSVGADRRALVDPDGALRFWNETNNTWEAVAGLQQVQDLAITPNNFIWAILTNGEIWANGDATLAEMTEDEESTQALPLRAITISAPTVSAQKAQAPTVAAPVIAAAQPETTEISGSSSTNPVDKNPAERPFSGPLTFTDTRTAATTLAIGGDGSVFALDAAGNLLRWSNRRQAFTTFPGTLSRIAVDKEGNPWGISALGRIFYHNGRDWKQIQNATASDIAVGYDGSVLIANVSGQLYKLDASSKTFKRHQGSGIKVAVQSDGTAWTIRSDLLVQRCDMVPCKTYPQKAIEIAAGPDGSIWIISEQNRLMRLANGAATFEVVQTAGRTPLKVAVGPSGYPWIISSESAVWATNFFEREETEDLKTAASTSATGTVGSGETSSVTSPTSGFIFSKNMSFETVPFSALSGGSCPSFKTGLDGTMWLQNNSSGQVASSTIEKYSSRKNKFEQVSTGFENWKLSTFDVGTGDEVWAIPTFPQNGLYRAQNKTLKKYTISGASDYKEVSAAVDGTVYVIAETANARYLYSKAPNSTVFRQFSTYADLRKVTVGPGGDIWIIGWDFLIRRWNGERFIEPATLSFKATDLSISKLDGTLYAKQQATANFYKWNASNKSFDQVRNITIDTFGVDGTGRPWLCNDTTPVIKRAKN